MLFVVDAAAPVCGCYRSNSYNQLNDYMYPNGYDPPNGCNRSNGYNQPTDSLYRCFLDRCLCLRCRTILQVLQPKQTQRITIIIDLAGVKFRDLVGESVIFLKTSVGMMSRHYPQRSFKVRCCCCIDTGQILQALFVVLALFSLQQQ